MICIGSGLLVVGVWKSGVIHDLPLYQFLVYGAGNESTEESVGETEETEEPVIETPQKFTKLLEQTEDSDRFAFVVSDSAYYRSEVEEALKQELEEVSARAAETYEAFYQPLSPEQKGLFEAHESARTQEDGMIQAERFTQGFKFGAKLMKELLDRE